MPDLFAFWLSGALANEATIASTTGLLDAVSGQWTQRIVRRLGLPARPFTGELLSPGTTLGSVSERSRGGRPRGRRPGARGRRPRHGVRRSWPRR